ncbi:MAG: signal peptide peptidase SppA [Deltaproteobacteria bacterium]|nr:signal peptide peptidase SppA [Deltaproteobacteria bacterium]
MNKRFFLFVLALTLAACLAGGCVGVKVSLETDSKKPLKEFTLQGEETGKVLVLPIRGFLSDLPRRGLLHERGGTVQEVVAQLRLAEKDQEIKALLLEINSPGGSITASDILYHEITAFKERTKAKIVAALMDVAASGGYYIALPADRIVAHPTTITGSVGVIFINPKMAGLMDKLGVGVEVNKSGQEKDIGSPFRSSTPEEQKIFQELTDKLGGRFVDLVAKHRPMDPQALARIATARIYLAQEALQLKLIDRIGYLDEAISEAKDLAGLSPEAKVVVYRRGIYPNDTPYNTAVSHPPDFGGPLVDLNLPEIIPNLNPGFYYLWMPGTGGH